MTGLWRGMAYGLAFSMVLWAILAYVLGLVAQVMF